MDLRRGDGWIGGVCDGIGHRVGLDPLLVRVGAVLLGLFFGLGLLLYLVAWSLIPDGADQTHVEQGLRHGKASSIVLLVFASVVLLGSLPWGVGGAFGLDGSFSLVGLVVAALLLRGLWALWQGRVAPGAVAYAADAQGAPTGEPAAGPPPVPRRPRRPSGGAAMALIATGLLLVIVAGTVWAGPSLDLPGDDLVVALAAVAVVLGLLVLGLGVSGRRAGFVGFLAVLTVLTVLTAFTAALLPARLGLAGGTGEVVWNPASVAELTDHRLGAGEADLDLRSLDPDELSSDVVDVSVGAGQLTVQLPAEDGVQVDSQIGVGRLSVRGAEVGGLADGPDDRSVSGLDIDESRSFGAAGSPDLIVRADLGVGEIVIDQEPTS